MNNKIRTLLAFSTLCLSSAAVPASATEFKALRADVPFAFAVGKTKMPAGGYTISENGAHMLTLRGFNRTVFFLSTPGEDTYGQKGVITFRQTEKGYQLQEIRIPGYTSSRIQGAPDGER